MFLKNLSIKIFINTSFIYKYKLFILFFKMNRKPNCSYHTGSTTEINAKYSNFCSLVTTFLETHPVMSLPNKNNIGYKTCGSNGGYWRIQFDRRVGHTGQLQIAISNHTCSGCFGFLNKALLLTKNHILNPPTNVIPIPIVSTIVDSPSTSLEQEEIDLPEDLLENLPENFKCPINMTLMRNPVICIDGHSYERSAIEEWFQKSNKSPLTNLVLESKILIPNHSLRKSIEEFIETHKHKSE
jgi:hypothetical protein